MSDKKKRKIDKEEPIQFSRVTKRGAETLFGDGSTKKLKQLADFSAADIAANVAECEKLGGPFALEDTIDTVVGPIGRFASNPDCYPLHPAMVLFGKRRTGKTYTLRDLLYHSFQDIPFGVVFTRTKDNGFWDLYVPPYLVFQGIQAHQLHRLVERQRSRIAKWKKDNPEIAAKEPDAYKKDKSLAAFVIFDDVISDQTSLRYNMDVISLFVEGRHMCISVFINTQYAKGIGPMLRGNCDYAVFQPVFQRDQREVLADLFGGWMDRNTFYALMDDIVMDENLEGSTPQNPKKRVRTMICGDFENTLNPQIKYRWYESIDPGEFHLCHPEYWKKAKQAANQMHKPTKVLNVLNFLESVSNGGGF